MMINNREILKKLFCSAVAAVDPYNSVIKRGQSLLQEYIKGGFKRVFVLAFGKASCPMTKAIEEVFGERVTAGVIITKYGHSEGYSFSERFRLYEAGHPVPDQKGLEATRDALEMLTDLTEDDLVIVLISGGGSALFISPVEGITLEDKMETTDILLRAGADIFELNTVRKRLSRVKGGKLAQLLYPARVKSFILSDVLGDRLDIIASGPTVKDPTTFEEAVHVLKKYNLLDRVPENVRQYLLSGSKKELQEFRPGSEEVFRRVENVIIGSNRIALKAALNAAEGLGLSSEIIDSNIQGEARVIGTRLAELALRKKEGASNRPLCLISGGETTVTVKGTGKGGRNTELALSFALQIQGHDGITLLSAGTDGTDGPTDAAGAIVDGKTIERGLSRGLDPLEYLENNDSYSFLEKTGDLFITGPTGTNVMDIQIIIIS
ncbi:MAG: glycerate kinase [Nitrospirae bacterium]|nr:glycerate kinase [Nitrospirota bacterium]